MDQKELTCLNCSTVLTGRAKKFCGRGDCQGELRRKTLKSNFWAGTLTKPIDRDTAREFLAEERGYKCEIEGCGVSEWMGKPITLHVDHINGDAANDHPSNLRLICPNCHSQTEFFGGRNKGRGRKSRGLALY